MIIVFAIKVIVYLVISEVYSTSKSNRFGKCKNSLADKRNSKESFFIVPEDSFHL